MRTETRTVRIGENMGPIDWSYPFRPHFNCYGTTDENRDRVCAQRVGWLRRIERDVRAGVPIRVTTDGGSPRGGIYPVIDIGMFDGYPYWKPTPSVQVRTFLGTDWYSFDIITNVYPGESGREILP